ncbi:60S ribosomal protein L23A, putative [Entamoeba invadens IP1]|uniref:60S ribosomal protein L23A, putative n=1 Tax=Entamoeba invadens IP1 TaxID=370355 RepID=A0A0A1U4K1_ENTIV|nr:60S ribosomal protein L23A, putative [Entamoeba invadens IP1]ELP89181.1 60S ribosomal protein L23A, putative [Entamoeba invadens IP1]|eukprot:XP_004255952.1 60S ribosomal protein L23A, putative [Entamoeba invadens IP1]
MAGKKVTSTHFRCAPTKKQPKSPKYARCIKSNRIKLDEFAVIKFPLSTETALKMIEDHNTIVFLCDQRANKATIKRAVEKRYQTKVVKINTLVRLDGLKKAFVRLAPNVEAMEVATKIGLF